MFDWVERGKDREKERKGEGSAHTQSPRPLDQLLPGIEIMVGGRVSS